MLGELFSLSEPQLTCLQSHKSNTHFKGLFGGRDKIRMRKCVVCLVAGSAWQRDICLVLSLHAYWEHETLWLLRCGHLDPCPFAELDMGGGRPSLWSSPVHQGLACMEGQGLPLADQGQAPRQSDTHSS